MTSNENTFFVTGQPLPSENDPRLLFAGEATDPKHWSFLHGARDSGIREAMRIISKSKFKSKGRNQEKIVKLYKKAVEKQ